MKYCNVTSAARNFPAIQRKSVSCNKASKNHFPQNPNFSLVLNPPSNQQLSPIGSKQILIQVLETRVVTVHWTCRNLSSTLSFGGRLRGDDGTMRLKSNDIGLKRELIFFPASFIQLVFNKLGFLLLRPQLGSF